MPDEHASKDAWDKLSKLGNFLAIVAIPVVLGIYGNVVSRSISEQETSLAYVELAVSILEEAPEEQNAADKALRDWAVRILQRYSDEPMDGARDALITHRLPPRTVLNSDAIRNLMLTPDRSSRLQTDTLLNTTDDDSIAIPRERLRNLDRQTLQQLDIDPSTIRDLPRR